jgi:hypothetical protein
MGMRIQVVVFWVVTPYNDTVGYQHFGWSCCLHLQVNCMVSEPRRWWHKWTWLFVITILRVYIPVDIPLPALPPTARVRHNFATEWTWQIRCSAVRKKRYECDMKTMLINYINKLNKMTATCCYQLYYSPSLHRLIQPPLVLPCFP